MRLVLIYPPLADPTQPYPALPALAAYLHMRGEHQAVQWDANIRYLRSVLTHDSIMSAAEIVNARLDHFRQHPRCSIESRDEYIVLVDAALKAPFVIDGIEGAVQELKTWECYQDLARLDRARRLVQEALAILSAATFPLRLSTFNTAVETLATPSALLGWAMDTDRNPFRGFLADSVLPDLKDLVPGAVGISVSFRSQVLGAATLALLIRKEMPDVPIILGGNLVSVWQNRAQDLISLFDWCDYLIPFEGESALNRLLTALDSGTPLDGVPNLIYCHNGQVKQTQAAIEDVDRLPTPDYGGLPLGLYLAPDIVYSLYTSRGCYWGRCAFCAVSPAMRARRWRQSTARIRSDICTLHEAYGARYITYADDCVSPTALVQIADAVNDYGGRIYWQAEVRFEPALTGELLEKLRQSGCLNLIFGLESMSPRVRNLMGKGTTNEDIERILADCRRLGIAFNLQFFFGFPGERPDEAEQTASFILSQAHGAATFSFGTFELQKGARVERAPQAYGVTLVHPDPGPLAVKLDYEPISSHGAATRERLRQQLAERMTYLHTGLSMNAQTLFLLDACGPKGLAALYKPAAKLIERPKTGTGDTDIMGKRLTSSPNLYIDTFLPLDTAGSPMTVGEPAGDNQILAYEYTEDTTLAISPAALWLLQQLDGSQTLAQFLASLPDDMLDLTETLGNVAAELYRRRFLVCPNP